MKQTSLVGTLALGLAILAILAVLPGRGFGGATAANAPAAGTSSVVTCGTWGNGPAALGDWGRFGPGMMGNAGHPGAQGLNGGMWGMMGSLGMLGSYSQADVPLAPSDVARRLAAFAASCGPDFHVANVTLFANDAYAQLSDGTGTRLGEVLVDRYTGLVVPEPGPNLLWNTRWGLAAGTLSPPRYDELAARELAATFLASYLPGATLRTGAALPGYDTFAYGRGQTIDGLLSVNTMTGAIWAHAWIGPALGGAE